MRTKEIVMEWGIGPKSLRYEIMLPAGLRVKPCNDGTGQYFLDEFPVSLPQPYTSFPIDSFNRHDAIHYGIRLNPDQVEKE